MLARTLALITAFTLVVAPLARAGESEAKDTAAKPEAEKTQEQRTVAAGSQDAKTVELPVYKLPPVGKPRRRIGGGRRGPAEALPSLFAVAPEHVGLTVSAQPVLCWFLSATPPPGAAFELTVIDEDSVEPLLDVQLPTPNGAGIQCTNLSDYGLTLAAHQEYEWSVAVVVDPEARSQDVIATGWIERVGEPDDLVASLERAAPHDATAIYAEAGLWYDAVSSVWAKVSDESHVTRGHAHQQLSSLLEQVDLDEVFAQ